MIKPVALKDGDTIGVIAPSDAVEKKSLEKSAEIVRKWGFKTKYGKHIYSKVGDFCAGTAEERMEDLKTMIYDEDVKMIWCATGGYAATEILPALDREAIEQLRKTPKLFLGYSDVCLMLNALTSFKFVSLMGPTLWGLSEWDKYSQESLRKIITGEMVPGIETSAKWRGEIHGNAEGQIIASNLETLIFSFGTKFDPFMYGNSPIILVLEELDIDKSTLQRQIDIVLSHKRSKRIVGVVIGRMTNIREMGYPKWGKKVTVQGLITARVKKLSIPLAFCQDFGHAEWDYGVFAPIKHLFANRRFLSVPNGIKARLTVGEKDSKLEYLETICETKKEDVKSAINESTRETSSTNS